MGKYRIVVVDERLLCVIHPGQKTSAEILRGSILRGAIRTEGSIEIVGARIRIASERDFDDFSIVVDGYINDPDYIFQRNS